MKMSLTKSRMLELWRVIRTGEPLRLDCTVTRTDGADYDALLTAEMRAWYLQLLDCGDEGLLAPVDCAAGASVSTVGGLTLITAPDGVRRILRLRFEDRADALSPTADEATVRACAANRFCRRPVAARIGPRTVIAAGVEGQLRELLCAMDFGEETYILDERALGNIEKLD